MGVPGQVAEGDRLKPTYDAHGGVIASGAVGLGGLACFIGKSIRRERAVGLVSQYSTLPLGWILRRQFPSWDIVIHGGYPCKMAIVSLVREFCQTTELTRWDEEQDTFGNDWETILG